MNRKTMRQMNRFLGRSALIVTLFANCSSLAIAQQPGGNQNVAPPSAGYGGRNLQNQNQNQPSASGRSAPPQNTNGNQPNPNLNPDLRSPANQPTTPNNPTVPSNPAVPAQPFQLKEPFGALKPAEQAYVDQVLEKWENSTKRIDRYSTDFKRWQFEPNNPTVNQLVNKTGSREICLTAATGVLKFSRPDKGMYRIDRLAKLTGEVLPNNTPELKEFAEQFGEYWICDGKSVYDYDRTDKKCTRFDMPPDMQGLGIINSPMPFLFGVEAAKLKERYWVRTVAAPMDANGQPRKDLIAIEAYPKYPSDAVNYDHVTVILDLPKFLPVMMILYNTQWRPDNDVRDVFEFTNREEGQGLLQKINENVFQKEFIPSEPPSDWTLEVRPYAPPAMENIQRVATPGVPNGQPISKPR